MVDMVTISRLMSQLCTTSGISYAVAPVCRVNDVAALERIAARQLTGVELRLFKGLRSAKRRAEFAAGRIAAKSLLCASPFSIRRDAIEIGRNARGAPGVIGREDLAVSISHTGGVAVAVASSGMNLGVDIEPDTPRNAALLDHFYTEQEKLLLDALEGRPKTTQINRLWTRKEAASKAGGWGGALVFRDIDCTGDAVVIENRHIRLTTVSGGGYVATLATTEDIGNG